MKNGKKVFTILSVFFLIVLIVIINSWIAKQVEKLSTASAMKKTEVAKIEPRSVVTKAVLPHIDPMNDPLAPVVKKVVPIKKTKSAAETMNSEPKKKYEFSSDEKYLIQ
ncbi:MAG: hypothetical protein KKD07_07430 [Candidatus Omnitrophica bacterium]|nr:hypothetical protein [Candidatus Omnitrophota bacterium]MBU4334253.1 hypothetical protein [Candidatus Omnitrophota bacterium]